MTPEEQLRLAQDKAEAAAVAYHERLSKYPSEDAVLAGQFAHEKLDDKYLWVFGLGWFEYQCATGNWAEVSAPHIREQARRWVIHRFDQAWQEWTQAARDKQPEEEVDRLHAIADQWKKMLRA